MESKQIGRVLSRQFAADSSPTTVTTQVPQLPTPQQTFHPIICHLLYIGTSPQSYLSGHNFMTTTPSNQLWLYDTTLRDGTQREGLSVSIEDKLFIAHRLDELGIPFIEGGWAGANPKDVQFFWQLQENPLKQAEIVPFCSTRRPHSTAAEEPMLQAILSAGTRWVTIFGKSWDLQVIEGLNTS